MMRWAIFTTCCSSLQSVTVQFLYHTVTLLMKHHQDRHGKVAFLQCPQEKEVLFSFFGGKDGSVCGPGQNF